MNLTIRKWDEYLTDEPTPSVAEAIEGAVAPRETTASREDSSPDSSASAEGAAE
jgi:hypothetical protein